MGYVLQKDGKIIGKGKVCFLPSDFLNLGPPLLNSSAPPPHPYPCKKKNVLPKVNTFHTKSCMKASQIKFESAKCMQRATIVERGIAAK